MADTRAFRARTASLAQPRGWQPVCRDARHSNGNDAVCRWRRAAMAIRNTVRATAVLSSLLLAACGGHSPVASSPIIDPPAALRPHVEVASIDVTGESRPTGNAYHVVAHLRETAGVPATITSIELRFLSGGTTVASSRSEQPISDASNL